MAGKAQRRFVRSAHVVCYWELGSLVLHNYATGTTFFGDARMGSIAAACCEPTTLDEIHGQCDHIARRSISSLVTLLVRSRILYDAGRPIPKEERNASALESWNPEVGFFHRATKDVQYGEREMAERLGAERARRRGRIAVKPEVNRPKVRMAVLPAPGEFPETLLARRTFRRFSRTPVALDHLNQLLRFTGGIQGWFSRRGKIIAPLRTSPSGGACHPIDLYVVAYRVKGLRSGVYRYAADEHALVTLREGVPRGRVERYLPHQYWYNGAGALVLFAATFERALSRYQYSRAYRSILIEAGHLCQTFCLTATWLGLAPFCSAALADTRIEGDLGLDGMSASVLYAAGVGGQIRPGVVDSAPHDVKPVQIVANPAFATPAAHRAVPRKKRRR